MNCGIDRGAHCSVCLASRSQRRPLSLGPSALDLSPPSRGEVKIYLTYTPYDLACWSCCRQCCGCLKIAAAAPLPRAFGPRPLPAFAGRGEDVLSLSLSLSSTARRRS